MKEFRNIQEQIKKLEHNNINTNIQDDRQNNDDIYYFQKFIKHFKRKQEIWANRSVENAQYVNKLTIANYNYDSIIRIDNELSKWDDNKKEVNRQHIKTYHDSIKKNIIKTDDTELNKILRGFEEKILNYH